ncbi:MAG TPA: hypothetical protein VGQ28_16255 [Thermoanaerobaculia bacterium]|nr:hypothetical protein [Thermoanaerobaculia bacterium]
MHVYIREEPVELEMREVDAEGLVPSDAELVPMAFFVDGNQRPSFRAMLPADTLNLLRQTLREPVHLGLLAEEPDEPAAEVKAMVGISIPVHSLPDGMVPEEMEEEEDDSEPWKTSANYDSWRGGDAAPGEGDAERTVLLAFAPLVRVTRRKPDDFAEELVDLLESAITGATLPSLEARVNKMLGL